MWCEFFVCYEWSTSVIISSWRCCCCCCWGSVSEKNFGAKKCARVFVCDWWKACENDDDQGLTDTEQNSRPEWVTITSAATTYSVPLSSHTWSWTRFTNSNSTHHRTKLCRYDRNSNGYVLRTSYAHRRTRMVSSDHFIRALTDPCVTSPWQLTLITH